MSGRPPPTILLASNLIWFTTFGSPWRSPLSAALAFVLNHAYNYSLSDVCTYGTLPSWPVPMDTIAALLGLRPFVRSCKGSINALGINHYFRSFTTCFYSTKMQMTTSNALVISIPISVLGFVGFRAAADDRFEQSDMGWDLTPSSLGRVVRVASQRYPSLPIHITESGCAAEDTMRTRYLVGCLGVLQQAVAEGADVRSYTYWSLMDNFEWAEGFGKRFGLAATDYDTLELTPRASAKVYADVIQKHRQRAR